MGTGRRRSVSSSRSDGESGNTSKGYDMGQSGAGFGPSMPLMPQGLPSFPVAGGDEMRGLHSPHPPAYSSPPVQAPPPSGYRIPLTTDAPFPPANLTLRAPFTDADGRAPVFFGSALFPNAVHPCKIAPHLTPPCRVPYAGQEWEHHGRYDLLPYAPDTMELVQTSGGRIPLGRRPVEGGYEETGQKLYHAVAMVNGLRVPGKAGEHLHGCNIAFGNQEHVVQDYELLCWR